MSKGLKAILTLINEENEHSSAYQSLLNDMYYDLKTFEIIKKHKVFVAFLLNSKDLYNYNSSVHWEDSELTQKEYELLKEVLL